jgi:hypothetical protein
MRSTLLGLATYVPLKPITWLTLCAISATSSASAQSGPVPDAVATLVGSVVGEDERATSDDVDFAPESARDEAKSAARATITAFAASSMPSGGRTFAFTLGQGSGPLQALALPKVLVGASMAAAENAAATSPPITDDGSGLRTAGYVAGGVGLAGLALFAIAGLSAKSAYDKLQADCGHTPCTDEAHRSDIEGGRMMQTAANIGLATGLVGLGVGATLLVLGNQSSTERQGPSATASANGAMITYGGLF